MILFGSIILALYIISMFILLYGYSKVEEFKGDDEIDRTKPTSNFSIIIPFRNEAENLPVLLDSILKLKYPKERFEIIFVDDESEDDSVEVINDFMNYQSAQLNTQKVQFKIIKNNRKSASPKKDAITEAVSISKNEWIITTDADCLVPEKWLLTFNSFILKNNPSMIVGPVKYFKKNNLLNNFQQLDNFSLQTTTVGSFGFNCPILCNGANLAYKNEAFKAVSGFLDNNHIASGDDIFLLEKFKNKFSKGVHFIKNKDSIVSTKAQDSWNSIINQRIRWASKTSRQKNVFALLLGIIVFLANLFLIVGSLIIPLQLGFYRFFLTFLIIKMILDFLVLHQTSTFFRSKITLSHYLINTFIYPIITVIVVLKSFNGNYNWKGRTYNSK